jgi:site-specific recombinase XerD
MPALVVPTANSGAIDRAVLDRAQEFIDESVSWNTRRAYESDWGLFTRWCSSHGVSPMPAAPSTLVGYAVHLADSGKKVATINRQFATIAKAHRIANIEPSPLRHSTVEQVLAGIRRKLGAPQVQKEAAVVELLRPMVDACDVGDRSLGRRDQLVALRDKAMLLFGFTGAFRRSELMAVEVKNLTFVKNGLRILVVGSKVDQEHKGEVIGITYARDTRYCAVRAIRDWLDLAGIDEGPVFRAIGAGGYVREGKPNPWIAGEMVAECVKRRAKQAGLDPSIFSGHSLRSGFATQSYIIGKSDRQIMRHGRWSSPKHLERYIREVDLFRDNPTDGLL